MKKPIIISGAPGTNKMSCAEAISRSLFEVPEIAICPAYDLEKSMLWYEDKKCAVIHSCGDSKKIVEIYLKIIEMKPKMVIIFCYEGKIDSFINFSHIRLN